MERSLEQKTNGEGVQISKMNTHTHQFLEATEVLDPNLYDVGKSPSFF